MILAHAGGWDEALLSMGAAVMVLAVLALMEGRARRQLVGSQQPLTATDHDDRLEHLERSSVQRFGSRSVANRPPPVNAARPRS